MRVDWNIACVCIMTIICIAAVAIAGLFTGHDGTMIALAFTALGAVPAGLITWGVMRIQAKNKTKEKGVE